MAAALTLLPVVSSGAGLVLGMAIALVFGNPYLLHVRKLTRTLLSVSVMGLGAGMNLGVVASVGLSGIGYTVIGIASSLLLGLLLGRLLRVGGDTGILITVGTAICGGSAIAAVAPTIGAKPQEVTVALGTVFLLNASALLLFPWIGHAVNLSQGQFGLWSALAIHDTSSVVGATMQYGSEALAVGTTVKLARALWIVPVTVLIGYLHSRRQQAVDSERAAAKKPWFILGFLAAAALVTYVPQLQEPGHMVEACAKRALVLTLFLIGSSLTRSTVRHVGLRPLLLGCMLWAVVASGTLAAIYTGVIR